jgi:hypothetical protein
VPNRRLLDASSYRPPSPGYTTSRQLLLRYESRDGIHEAVIAIACRLGVADGYDTRSSLGPSESPSRLNVERAEQDRRCR